MMFGIDYAIPNFVGNVFRADALVGWEIGEQAAKEVCFNGRPQA